MGITVQVKLTANHKGYMVFKLCPSKANPVDEVSQQCLDGNVLDVAGRNDRKYFPGPGTAKPFAVKLRLPEDLTCARCVIQWTYRAGNSWGCESVNGKKTCGLGKGNQETFVNCADISIKGDGKGGAGGPGPKITEISGGGKGGDKVTTGGNGGKKVVS